MPLSPFLLAVWPILVEYAGNTTNLTPFALVRPLALALVGAFLLVLACLKRHPRRPAAGLLACLVVGLFWGYGTALWLLELVGLAGALSFALAPALAVGALVGLARWMDRRPPGDELLGRLDSGVTALALILVLLAVGNVFRTERAHRHPLMRLAAPRFAVPGRAARRPDIYLVVLDAYARDDYLAGVYGHDNGPFLRELERRGFYVAGEARSNYAWTSLSVASMLSAGYLDFSPEQKARAEASGGGYEFFREMVRESSLQRLLEAQGYRTVSVACGDWKFDHTSYEQVVGSHWEEFEILLFGRSALGELLPDAFTAARRHQLEQALAALRPPEDGPPVFKLIHVLAPHPPFVFAADGSPGETIPLFELVDSGPGLDRVMGEGWYRRRYLEQLTWLNRRVLEQLDLVLARTDREAVILLQGDHGSRGYLRARHQPDPELRLAEQLREIHGVLSAYRVPTGMRSRLYPQVTPVNAVRMLLDELFDTRLGVLDDRSFASPLDQPWVRREVPPLSRL